MGCKPAKRQDAHSAEANILRAKIVQMLKMRRDELALSPPVTFSKILMKAGSMNATYRRIRGVYDSLDADRNGQVSESSTEACPQRSEFPNVGPWT